MPITVHSFRLGPMENNTYLLMDNATQEAILVDPSFGSEEIASSIEALNCKIVLVLNTHGHFDHVIGNRYWVEKTGTPLAIHSADLELLNNLQTTAARYGFTVDSSPQPTQELKHGQQLTLGESEIAVRHVPGHAPGHVVLVFDNTVLSGDCLFKGSIGRTDLAHGDLPALLKGIASELLTLPDDTMVFPGHGDPTTIGNEKQSNPYIVSVL